MNAARRNVGLASTMLFVLACWSNFVFAQSTATSPPRPATAKEWQDAAKRDLNEAYRATIDNHPGMHDPFNKGFPKRLEDAANEALALAAKIDGPTGYRAVFERFSTIINDGHAGAYATLDKYPPGRWPGFITVWRGQDLFVYEAEADGPPKHAKVISCDNKPIREVILGNVFRFQGRSNEAGNWWIRARSVFYDRQNPFVVPPQSCTFELNGKSQSYTLKWRESNDNFVRWRNECYNGDELAVGLTEPKPGIKWIAMPSFQPDEAQRTAYRDLYKLVREKRADFLAAQAVVLDLRHNEGGSSEWSRQLADELWGRSRVRRSLDAYFAKVEIWWRPSPDNVAHVINEAKVMRQQGRVEVADQWSALGLQLQRAMENGEKFFVQKSNAPKQISPDVERPDDPPAFTRPVYVIVPGQCASACLDAIDVFTRFQNVKLIGAPSSADSTYMEVRSKKVSSGMATVIIPNKMWVHRPRGSGEGYRPAIEVTAIDWSTRAFVAAVERDLQAK